MTKGLLIILFGVGFLGCASKPAVERASASAMSKFEAEYLALSFVVMENCFAKAASSKTDLIEGTLNGEITVKEVGQDLKIFEQTFKKLDAKKVEACVNDHKVGVARKGVKSAKITRHSGEGGAWTVIYDGDVSGTIAFLIVRRKSAPGEYMLWTSNGGSLGTWYNDRQFFKDAHLPPHGLKFDKNGVLNPIND